MDAILFDFDGVLVDSLQIKEHAFGVLYREHGTDIANNVMQYHRSHGGMSRFEKFEYCHNQFLGQHLSLEERNILSDRFAKLVMQGVIQANEMPYAAEVLHGLQAYPLHLISATPAVELQDIIAARDMTHFFRSIHGSPQTKAAHIEALIAQHGYNKTRVVLIGDAYADYEATVSTGIMFIGYLSSSTASPFASEIPVINDLRMLLDHVAL